MSRGARRLWSTFVLLPLVLGWAHEARSYAFLRPPDGGGVAWRWDLGSLSSGRIPWHLAEVVSPQVIGDRSAECRITERTPQGRYSVAGVGTPTYALDDVEVVVPRR